MDPASPRNARNSGGQDGKWWHAFRANCRLHKVSRGTIELNAALRVAATCCPDAAFTVPSTLYHAHMR
jgi:hypothetical protein